MSKLIPFARTFCCRCVHQSQAPATESIAQTNVHCVEVQGVDVQCLYLEMGSANRMGVFQGSLARELCGSTAVNVQCLRLQPVQCMAV